MEQYKKYLKLWDHIKSLNRNDITAECQDGNYKIFMEKSSIEEYKQIEKDFYNSLE